MDMDAASVRQSLHRHFLKLPFEPVDPGSHADWDRAPPEYTSKTSAIPILPTKELNNDTSRCGTAKHSSIDTEDAYCTYSIHDDDDDIYDLKAPPEYTSQASFVPSPPIRGSKDDTSYCRTPRHSLNSEDAHCLYSIHDDEPCDADPNNDPKPKPDPSRRNNPALPRPNAFADALANIVIPTPGTHNRPPVPTVLPQPTPINPDQHAQPRRETSSRSRIPWEIKAERNYILIDATTRIHGSNNVTTPDFSALGIRLASRVSEMLLIGQVPGVPPTSKIPQPYPNGDYGNHWEANLLPQPPRAATSTAAATASQTPTAQAQAQSQQQRARAQTQGHFGPLHPIPLFPPPPSVAVGPCRIEVKCGLDVDGHQNIVAGPSIVEGLGLKVVRSEEPAVDRGLTGRGEGQDQDQGTARGEGAGAGAGGVGSPAAVTPTAAVGDIGVEENGATIEIMQQTQQETVRETVQEDMTERAQDHQLEKVSKRGREDGNDDEEDAKRAKTDL